MNPTVQTITLELDEAKAMVAAGKALSRLMMNQDFKLLVTDGFAKQEAIRLVNFRASEEVQSNEYLLKRVDRGIDAIGYLQEYLRKIEIEAEMAEEKIREYMEEGLV